MVGLAPERRFAPAIEQLGNAVHVFSAELDDIFATGDDAATLLSDDELCRAGRLRFDRDRHRFMKARALLRTIIGDVLGASPRAIRFHYGAHGKPMVDMAELASSSGREHGMSHTVNRGLSFNLSHAGSRVLIAVASAGALGVDLERVRDDFDTCDLEWICLAPSERSTLLQLEGAARRRAFSQIWTRKEAYLQAVGVGIGISLPSVAIEPRVDMPGVMRVVGAQESTDWRVHDLPVLGTHAGALAVVGTRPIVLRAWTSALAVSSRDDATPLLPRRAAIDGDLRHDRAHR
jgi:4'-phosphopantetheinyl transferase